MTFRLRWTIAASTDLQDYLDYISEHNPRAAARLAERILAVEKIIQQWPYSGGFDADTDLYEHWVPGSRLKLVYVVGDSVIEIIAAFHTSRNPKAKP